MAFPVEARRAAQLGLAAVGAALLGVHNLEEDKFQQEGVSDGGIWFSSTEGYVLFMILAFAAGMALVFLGRFPEMAGPVMMPPLLVVLLAVAVAVLFLDALSEPSSVVKAVKLVLLRGAV